MTDLGEFKRGDDLALADIEVTDDLGDPVDLSGNEYDVVCQVRTDPDAVSFVPVTVDAGLLADGIISLSIPRSASSLMRWGDWHGDVEITGPNGRQSTGTFSFTLLPDYTRV